MRARVATLVPRLATSLATLLVTSTLATSTLATSTLATSAAGIGVVPSFPADAFQTQSQSQSQTQSQDQPPQAPPPADGAPLTPEQVSKLPWPILLGLRTAAAEHGAKIVNEVVLVPDGRTYLDEVSRWTSSRRWPVLIEDDFYTPLFIRGFNPSRVVRRTSVGEMPATREEREQLIAKAAAEAIVDGASDVMGACAARGIPPSMLVVTDAMDGAWTAALALSAGRFAPIHFTSASYGKPADWIKADTFAGLSAELERGAERTGLSWRGLGDMIDAFVICRDFGWSCVLDLPDGVRWELADVKLQPGDAVATLNAIARHPDGVPWALGGGIFGSEERCAYVAMCSLFAPREKAWFFNAHPVAGATKDYDVRTAKEFLAAQGFETQAWSEEKAALEEWQRVLMGGFGCDVLFVNTRGMSDHFLMWKLGMGGVADVPFFDRPCMVHFLHSYSLQRPADVDTIGGAFIERGAYAYFGSVREPYLNAFLPPKLIAQRTEAFIPFAAAARHFEGVFARPWRVSYYGDPLTLLATPARIRLERVGPPADAQTAVRDLAAESLRRYRDDKDEKSLLSAIADLEAIGDDEFVLRTWRIAEATDAAPAAARHALGALFRARDLDGYARAFAQAGPLERPFLVMMWQLAVPRLASLSDPRTVAILGANTRGIDPSVDLALLRETGTRVLGREGWSSICERARRRTDDAESRKRIDALR